MNFYDYIRQINGIEMYITNRANCAEYAITNERLLYHIIIVKKYVLLRSYKSNRLIGDIRNTYVQHHLHDVIRRVVYN